MDFALLILVTAFLRIRPEDFVPALEPLQVYAIAILVCTAFALHKLAAELSAVFAGQRPIVAFMFGIMIFIFLSDAAQGEVALGLNSAFEFVKVIVFVLLLVGIVDSPGRLRWFLACVVVIDLVPTSLATLHYYGYIHIPAFDALASTDTPDIDPDTGGAVIVRRLIATGMFADPNDFSEILNTGLMFCFSGLLEKAAGFARGIWLAPIALFGWALKLTGSRGGLLGTFAGLAVLFWARFGRRKAILAALIFVPLFLMVAKGRFTQFSASEGTGKARVEIWHESFDALRHSTIIFGVGALRHVEVVGRATHNGFLCAFTELGILGGSLYFGAFYYALTTLWRLGSTSFTIHDPVVRRLHPYILAALVGYAINEMSLTHPYTVVTYMMLGLATVCLRLADPDLTLEGSRLSGKMVMQVFKVSAIFLVLLFAFVRAQLGY